MYVHWKNPGFVYVLLILFYSIHLSNQLRPPQRGNVFSPASLSSSKAVVSPPNGKSTSAALELWNTCPDADSRCSRAVPEQKVQQYNDPCSQTPAPCHQSWAHIQSLDFLPCQQHHYALKLAARFRYYCPARASHLFPAFSSTTHSPPPPPPAPSSPSALADPPSPHPHLSTP